LNKTGDELNIKLVIEYDGKKYFGWQRQLNKPTVQGTIEKTLQILFPGRKIKLTGAGRTDTGVHALGQTANFFISKQIFYKLGRDRLLRSLNGILPEDISVKSLNIASNEFHSRFSAKSRTYRYLISTRKRSYNGDKYFFLKTKFDIDLAKEFCKLLVGKHSFRSFCKNRTDKHDFLCIVEKAGVKKLKDGSIEFEIAANRFLYSMVRAVVGVMLDAASSKISINDFKQKFHKGERLKIQYVPSNALVLYKINY